MWHRGIVLLSKSVQVVPGVVTVTRMWLTHPSFDLFFVVIAMLTVEYSLNKIKKGKKNSPRAHMMLNALYGPVFVITPFHLPPCHVSCRLEPAYM